MEQIDYTIGDEIVALRTHSQKVFKVGEVFKCKGLKESECGCIVVNIGVPSMFGIGECTKCNRFFNDADGVWWMGASSFKKLDNLVTTEQLHDMLPELIHEYDTNLH